MYLLLLLGILILGPDCTKANIQESCTNNLQYPVSYLGDTSPGSVWPKPQYRLQSTDTYIVEYQILTFTYHVDSFKCDILSEAFRRYELLIREATKDLKLKFYSWGTPTINEVQVKLMEKCEDYPHLGMKEEYTLSIDGYASLESKTVWGILRGLETFSQILYQDKNGNVIANKTSIIDYPRFSHRGVLLDTARHYLPKGVILKNLEAMAYNKFNVLHWHIVDDQSFPYVSKSFPDLSEKGAYHPVSHIYTPEDVHEIVEYARLRGIRVIPEFDSPGHTGAWGKGQPGILTPCYDTKGNPNGIFGPIDPTNEKVYSFFKDLLGDIRESFPEKYIHLGGDEVSFSCWKSNPKITEWMKANNISGNYAKLEEVYIQRILNISSSSGFNYIVWQEVFDNGCVLDKNTVVEVWINSKPFDQVTAITKKGFRTLISAPWYLDYISYGADWQNYYKFEPFNFNGTQEQKDLIIGGETCLWAEYVDATNVTPRLWPRASAVAERLWSKQSVNNVDEAALRLHQHRCRMVNRGIEAEPIHPGFCNEEWKNI